MHIQRNISIMTFLKTKQTFTVCVQNKTSENFKMFVTHIDRHVCCEMNVIYLFIYLFFLRFHKSLS